MLHPNNPDESAGLFLAGWRYSCSSGRDVDDINRDKLKAELSAKLGRRLATARAERGWSQEDLSEISGVSVDTISKIERGAVSRLDLGTYGALTRALDVDPTWFETTINGGAETISLIELMFSDANGERDAVVRLVEERLTVQTRDEANPLLILVGGYAGSGKSEFGKAVAQVTGWPVVDKDVTARPMTEQLLEALGQDRNDRHGQVYIEKVRPLEYRCTMEAAERNIQCGHSTIVTAPFLREMSSPTWTSELKNRCEWIGCEPVYVWMDCDMDTMRVHIERRGAARDAWKIANWSEYEATVDLAMRPCVPHVVVDNRANAALSLAAQALALTQRSGQEG